jgi:hypothetical protein
MGQKLITDTIRNRPAENETTTDYGYDDQSDQPGTSSYQEKDTPGVVVVSQNTPWRRLARKAFRG